MKNTILTDFIDLVEQYSAEEQTEPEKKIIENFSGYTISAPKDSLSYIALISPYLSMLKSGSSVPAGEFNIAMDKLDNAMNNAKGYYEFLGEKESKKVIFRFNIKAFKNNYKAPDRRCPAPHAPHRAHAPSRSAPAAHPLYSRRKHSWRTAPAGAHRRCPLQYG